MGVASTLRVSRDAALLALAKIQYKGLSDDALGDMVDAALKPSDGGEALVIRQTRLTPFCREPFGSISSAT